MLCLFRRVVTMQADGGYCALDNGSIGTHGQPAEINDRDPFLETRGQGFPQPSFAGYNEQRNQPQHCRPSRRLSVQTVSSNSARSYSPGSVPSRDWSAESPS